MLPGNIWVSGQAGARPNDVQPDLRDRVLLVGDAGGFVDPLTGEGIYGALLSGQAAASAILSETRGEGTAAEAFAGCLDGYRQTLRFSSRAATAFYANPARGFRAMRIALRAPVAGQDLYPWTQCQEPGHARRTVTGAEDLHLPVADHGFLASAVVVTNEHTFV